MENATMMNQTAAPARSLESINENVLVNLHDAHDLCARIESTLSPRPIADDKLPVDPVRLGLLAQAEIAESLSSTLAGRLRAIHEHLGVK